MTVHVECRIARAIDHTTPGRWTWWICHRDGAGTAWYSGTAWTWAGAWWARRRALRALEVKP